MVLIVLDGQFNRQLDEELAIYKIVGIWQRLQNVDELQIRQLEKHDKHILFEEYVPSGQALIH
jgi:hypothetical protein